MSLGENDAVARPQWGVGSLVTFQAMDEGILERGAETIRAAIDLRKAAVIAAATPMPSGVIRNNGADLDPKEVQGLLAAWKNARTNRSTAYLTSTLEYQPETSSQTTPELVRRSAIVCVAYLSKQTSRGL